jgi:hypothetical protein
MTRIVPALTSVLCLACACSVAADEPSAVQLQWKLSDDIRSQAVQANPLLDRDQEPVWYLLRTTGVDGPVESRNWLRDGRYLPLTENGDKLFESPVAGWAYRAGQRLAPLAGRVTAEYDVGLKFNTGDILIAPGPEHAMVIGWRSPVAGMLDIQGLFEHAQNCCGVNSQIQWYIERGPAPDETHGFQPMTLASGNSDFGTATQVGAFQIRDQPIQPGEFIYFIVDAFADGTATPHHGDGTRFDVTLTVRDARRPSPPRFEQDIQPTLARKCHDCHGADLQESKLDLRTLSTIFQGGESGPAIVAGDPAGSLLIDLVTRGQMPPDGCEKVSATELSALRRWIQAGAPAEEAVVALPHFSQVSEQDRQYWAFQSPRKAIPPPVRQVDRVHSTIDAFLLAQLEGKQLAFSLQADRATLIRRAYFDLIGLPPEPDSVLAFLADSRPDAFDSLLDKLLASPQYGARWGRHWLDAAGYVDNRLFDGDLASIYPNEGIWRYRDYVVKSFNADQAYDRFIVEQLAGDELIDWRNADSFGPETLSLLSATGFLRCVEDHTSEPQYGIDKRYEVIHQVIDMLSTSVLGLTMECCRCHNHKYDPLPQRDYYRLMACFEPALNVHDWKRPQERFLADVAPTQRAAIDAHNSEIDKQIAVLQPELKAAEEAKDEHRIAELKKQLGEAQGRKKSYGKLQALWDVGPAPASRVHRRGNVHAPGVLVQAGFPQILQPPGQSVEVISSEMPGGSTGRRLALARWLVRPDHPLTGRVIANRVWHHHFGRGIVETLGNFGRSGSSPTHPELLDWLAVDLIEHGWSLKRLHRQIMLSTAFQQSSRRPRFDAGSGSIQAIGERTDPGNLLLWRMNLRRLEAEIVRDAILAVSDALDLAPGGPPDEITKPADGLSQTASHRRSLYLFARRVYPLKFLEIFDTPIMPVNCTQRMSSATVLQSLAQLNSQFVLDQAERMARRAVELGGPDSAAQIAAAFQCAFARQPQATELEQSLAFIREQLKNHESAETPVDKAAQAALADLCQMLLSANEFLYVE